MTGRYSTWHDAATTGATAALVVGFLALAAAVVAAYVHPATAYEVSIYAATPALYWLGLAVALGVAVVVSLFAPTEGLRGFALLLGGGGVLSFAGLPVVRGYRFFGPADAMTHLGWARDVAAGTTSPFGLIYPGLHTVAVLVRDVTGLGLARSTMLAALAFVAVFVLFVPLAVRAVADDGLAVAAAGLSALLLLPVNTVSTHLHAHPFTGTTLFSALVVYLAFRYVTAPPPRTLRPVAVTPVGVLLALSSAALVVLHPQQAANVLLAFVAVSAVQFAARRGTGGPLADHRPLSLQTLFLGVVLVAWTRGALAGHLAQITDGLATVLLGAGQPAARIGSQGASLSAIGAGLGVVFARLFLVSALFVGLSALVVAAALRGDLADAPDLTDPAVRYLAAAGVAVVPLFAAYFVGNVAEHYFRQVGFLMLLATLLGALALARFGRGPGLLPGAVARVALVVLFAVVIPLSLLSAFPSPYVYQPTGHVTATAMDGYETAFEVRAPDRPVAGVRQGPFRWSEAIHGVAGADEYRASVPDGGLSDLRSHFDGEAYLAVTTFDRERELVAYRGLRYSRAGFDSLDAQPGVSRVVANGGFRLYAVEG